MNIFNIFKKSPYERLKRNPPLVDKKQKIALLWTPKTGCTFTTKWFFSQIDELAKAEEYHGFVHQYRTKVYQKSEAHVESLNDFVENPKSYRVIKVIRDPHLRAVSSYLHANKWKFSDDKISKFLNRELNNNQRFSFSEFIEYLASVNIHDCNPHYKSQIHYLELKKKLKPDYIINLPNATEELCRLEVELDLLKTDVKKLVHSKHHTKRDKFEGFYGDKVLKIKKGEVLPQAEQFYNQELKNKVSEIYKDDIKRYSRYF